MKSPNTQTLLEPVQNPISSMARGRTSHLPTQILAATACSGAASAATSAADELAELRKDCRVQQPGQLGVRHLEAWSFKPFGLRAALGFLCVHSCSKGLPSIRGAARG